MSEQPDQEERTESATPKRLEESRRKGEVPRSRDLNAAAVTLFSCGAIAIFAQSMAAGFAELMRASLSLRFTPGMGTQVMMPALGDAALAGFMTVMPVLAAGFVAAILAPMMLSGWNFSTEALVPKFSRMDPLAGMKRLVSANGMIELLKSILKFSMIAAIAIMLLRKSMPAFLAMGKDTPISAMKLAADLCVHALLMLSLGMLLIATIDVPIQLWQHAKQLRMSQEEIRKEMKESDGSPEVKSKIRRLQQEAARNRMMAEVPKADVIVTNPTHFAVALRYDDKRNRAPIVVAKGADLIAARIREIAAEHNVVIFEAPPLARVLFRSVDLNQEIPASLYTAVAQVLTYVFQLRTFHKGQSMRPVPPAIEVQE
jgi:flagellar biosynthetic protein FlhB